MILVFCLFKRNCRLLIDPTGDSATAHRKIVNIYENLFLKISKKFHNHFRRFLAAVAPVGSNNNRQFLLKRQKTRFVNNFWYRPYICMKLSGCLRKYIVYDISLKFLMRQLFDKKVKHTKLLTVTVFFLFCIFFGIVISAKDFSWVSPWEVNEAYNMAIETHSLLLLFWVEWTIRKHQTRNYWRKSLPSKDVQRPEKEPFYPSITELLHRAVWIYFFSFKWMLINKNRVDLHIPFFFVCKFKSIFMQWDSINKRIVDWQVICL